MHRKGTTKHAKGAKLKPELRKARRREPKLHLEARRKARWKARWEKPVIPRELQATEGPRATRDPLVAGSNPHLTAHPAVATERQRHVFPAELCLPAL
jgi:hypothetical protein